jgi:hypothetical protein
MELVGPRAEPPESVVPVRTAGPEPETVMRGEASAHSPLRKGGLWAVARPVPDASIARRPFAWTQADARSRAALECESRILQRTRSSSRPENVLKEPLIPKFPGLVELTSPKDANNRHYHKLGSRNLAPTATRTRRIAKMRRALAAFHLCPAKFLYTNFDVDRAWNSP